jgi:hypothetical protein
MKVIEREEPDIIFVQELYEYKKNQLGLIRSTEPSRPDRGSIEQQLLFKIIN